MKTKYNLTPIYKCVLVREGSVKTDATISSTERAKAVCIEFLKDSPNEQFCAVLLDTKNKMIGIHVVSFGVLDAALVHPRETFRPAIIANASSILIVHNHPSGDLTPSREDWAVFERLQKAGELIGINVIDSIICNDTTAYSMRELKA